MAKRSDHSGGTALKTRPRAGHIVLWAVLAALLLGAVIGVVSLLGRPSGTETPENTAAPTAAPDTSGTPSETPLPEELREAPLSPEAEIAERAAVRSNGFPMPRLGAGRLFGRQPGPDTVFRREISHRHRCFRAPVRH